MTNYEAIKNMNIREMTGFLFAFLLPWTKAHSKEQKEHLWKQLESFLTAQRKETVSVSVEDLNNGKK